MITAFDHIAATYDNDFTHGSIGALQRQKVWDYLEKALPDSPLSILELNCGTGEDAVHLAGQGHNVLATDLSKEMVAVAKSKAENMGLGQRTTFIQCDINKIAQADFDSKFDLIFSNFGGLNCIDAMSLQNLSKVASRLLKPNGRFIGVIMPAFCVWESIYFLQKFKVKKAFRRTQRGPLLAQLNEAQVETWYYTPARIETMFRSEFKLVGLKPIGFFLPPSYLENFFRNKQGMLNKLDSMEDKVNAFSHLSNYSDHYLIDLELTKTTS
ncbi:class I SAM-dependent methyltransferase [Fulvivirga kasyanovii]|uniref:Class I SAM-dependent methyltransferase n=1 Tax=Fulvivirga kasyanovii TaxID=396812 RepID=A0ABW9RL01_9BACT|nr:class I SAM-dependent methyltransferase [Fulvivirga kasyanovii]MTI24759.1 class I SAM-dependent methyltransferase [Fulvivirga kasyanovii]